MSSERLPDVSSKFGAPMGRGSAHSTEAQSPKLRMARVRLDNGGYDNGGAYWGHGEPLYHVESENGEIDYFVRGYDRERAKREVRAKYPTARFYN
jgi:hypothetical protein